MKLVDIKESIRAYYQAEVSIDKVFKARHSTMKHSKEVFKINLKGLKIAMKNLRASNQVVFAMNLCMP